MPQIIADDEELESLFWLGPPSSNSSKTYLFCMKLGFLNEIVLYNRRSVIFPTTTTNVLGTDDKFRCYRRCKVIGTLSVRCIHGVLYCYNPSMINER